MFGDTRLPERFWAKVDASGDCWLWTGAKVRDGYGSFRDYRTSLPHRLAYMVLVGEIPSGHEVDHLCRVTSCVNPAHLEAVTPRVNALRSANVAAHYAQRTHCKWNHPFSPENTEVKGGTRYCLTCRQDRRRQQSLERRRRRFERECPELNCDACGKPTPMSREEFIWTPLVFCVYCGHEQKNLTHLARGRVDNHTGRAA